MSCEVENQVVRYKRVGLDEHAEDWATAYCAGIGVLAQKRAFFLCLPKLPPNRYSSEIP